MKQILFSLICLCCSISHINAQSISGTISDNSGSPLVAATIEVLTSRDSTHISGTTADLNGSYKFDIAAGSYIIRTSYVGYTSAQKRIILFNNHNLQVNFMLQEEAMLLDEVAVIATGVVVKGDTTTYFTNSYRTGHERNLKDVLEVLPGVKVDPNTNAITANGKSIRKILIENQDIFQGSTSVPMDNLSADGIKSVEVIDNYSEYNIYDGFRTSNETVINLNVTDDMKGRISGDTELYGGVLNKYQVKNSSILIGKKVMVSGIASANNTGNNTLKASDIIGMNGGYNELLSNENPVENIERTLKAYSSFIDYRKNVYKKDNGVISLNMALNPSSKVKVLWNGIAGLDNYKLKSEERYNYISGLEYTDIMNEKQKKQHYMTNLKISYIPHETFNIYYKGKLYYAHRNQDISNSISNEMFYGITKNDNFTTENKILAVKAFGKNTLNLSLDINYSSYKKDYLFNTDSDLLYTGIDEISNNYAYLTNQSNCEYSAQLFYLHRLSDKYFIRVGLQSVYDINDIKTRLIEELPSTLYNNDNYANYWDNNLNVRLCKDQGIFTFTIGAILRNYHISDNLRRDMLPIKKVIASPNATFTYRFSNMHFISVAYDELLKYNSIDDLTDNSYIQNYNQIIHNSVNRYNGYTRKASMTHMLMIPLHGFTMTNMLSYECIENDIINNHHQTGIVDKINRQTYDTGINSVSIISSVEKRFMIMPLNTKFNFNYTYNDTPLLYNDKLVNTKFNSYTIQGIISTHYKNGVNGKITADILISNYKNNLSDNKLFNIDYLALLSYNTNKLYAAFDVRFRDYRINESLGHNMYLDFEFRYNISSKLSLYCIGNDFLNLKGRIQEEVVINDYFTNTRLVHYIPGYIMCGITLKH